MIAKIVRTAPTMMPAIAMPLGAFALPSCTAAMMLRMRPTGGSRNASTRPMIDSTRPGGDVGTSCAEAVPGGGAEAAGYGEGVLLGGGGL